MNAADRRLLRHLAWVLALKTLALVLLWWLFVHDAGVDADAERTAAHFGAPATSAGAPR